MKKLKKLALLAAVAMTAALFASCDYWGKDWYETGDSENAPLNGSGVSGSSGNSGTPAASTAGTTQAVYTSYDSAGGYFNVGGGQYRTCTLVGNSQGGTITLSNGVLADLTGTYGNPDGTSGSSPVALAAAAESGEIRIEGCWTVTFNGANRSYSYSVLVTKNLISIRCTGSDGTKALFTAGAAVSADHADAVAGGSVVPGSADDPFNGTRWGSTPSNNIGLFKFENGTFYRYTGHYEAFGPYTVKRTGDGYKVCFGFLEQSASGSNSNGSWDYWNLGYHTLTIRDAGATEAKYVVEVTLTYSGSGNAVNGTYDYSADYSITYYKVTE